MDIFSKNSSCPKCGNTTASARWCGGAADKNHIPGCMVEGEHIHRICARCGYEWLELPLDTVP